MLHFAPLADAPSLRWRNGAGVAQNLNLMMRCDGGHDVVRRVTLGAPVVREDSRRGGWLAFTPHDA